MDRGDVLPPVLAQREVRMRISAHRAGAVEGDGRGDVLEVVRLHEPQQALQASPIQLEHAQSLAPGQELVGIRGHPGPVLEIEVHTLVLLDVLDRIGDDREVPQAQEVHLDEAQALRRRVVELGDDLAVLEPAHDRDDVDDRLRRHDDTGSVDTPLPFQPLEPLRRLEDVAGLRVGVEQCAELTRLVVAGSCGILDVGEWDVLGRFAPVEAPS